MTHKLTLRLACSMNILMKCIEITQLYESFLQRSTVHGLALNLSVYFPANIRKHMEIQDQISQVILFNHLLPRLQDHVKQLLIVSFTGLNDLLQPRVEPEEDDPLLCTATSAVLSYSFCFNQLH